MELASDGKHLTPTLRRRALRTNRVAVPGRSDGGLVGEEVSARDSRPVTSYYSRRGRCQCARQNGEAFVSTGRLPAVDEVTRIVTRAYELFRNNVEGTNSDTYPALARVAPDLFGVCVVAARGDVFEIGATEHQFSIMSVSKPFVFALMCEILGSQESARKAGANATGLPFNSLSAVEGSATGRTNPMVNAGAIATTSLAPGLTPNEKWDFIADGLSRFAGRALQLNDDVYALATATNFRNRSIAWLLETRKAAFIAIRSKQLSFTPGNVH